MISNTTHETTLPQWSKDLPENFNPQEFKDKLADMCQAIAGMIEDNGTEYLYDFFPKVLDALVTHETFNTWNNGTRLRVIGHWDAIRYIVEKLCEVLTPEINESTSGIEQFIDALIIPNHQND